MSPLPDYGQADVHIGGRGFSAVCTATGCTWRTHRQPILEAAASSATFHVESTGHLVELFEARGQVCTQEVTAAAARSMAERSARNAAEAARIERVKAQIAEARG